MVMRGATESEPLSKSLPFHYYRRVMDRAPGIVVATHPWPRPDDEILSCCRLDANAWRLSHANLNSNLGGVVQQAPSLAARDQVAVRKPVDTVVLLADPRFRVEVSSEFTQGIAKSRFKFLEPSRLQSPAPWFKPHNYY